MSKRIYLVTKNEHGGCQRKLAWFSKHNNDLYFEVFAFLMGSHTSYHRDGSIWRTSPTTKRHANKVGQCFPLDEFKGWYQLGTSMIVKNELLGNPCIKKREISRALNVQEVDLEEYPSKIINVVVEFIEPSYLVSMPNDIKPPKNARVLIINSVKPYIVLTILGHDNNLLIRPKEDGFVVSHYNNRYSTNLPGVKYKFEAYG